MIVIYKIINLITHDEYIGSAINFKKRKYRHIKRLNENNHHSQFLQNSWNKYGSNNFSFIIVENVNDDIKLIEREQWWIDNSNSTFNMCRIACSPLGRKHTKETKEKLSIITTGKYIGKIHTKESKKNMSDSHIGKKLTKESIEKRTLKQKGQKRSDETKQNMSDAYYKKNKHKPIYRCDLNNNILDEWLSVTFAAKTLKMHRGYIYNCCKGTKKTYNNYIWRYKNAM